MQFYMCYDSHYFCNPNIYRTTDNVCYHKMANVQKVNTIVLTIYKYYSNSIYVHHISNIISIKHTRKNSSFSYACNECNIPYIYIQNSLISCTQSIIYYVNIILLCRYTAKHYFLDTYNIFPCFSKTISY